MRSVIIVLSVLVAVAPCLAGAVEVKDPEPADPNSVGTPSEATGGPDPFGYTFADGAEPGVNFDWIDISATGTAVGTGDDSGYPVTLGAAFSFYGGAVTQVAMTTNGYISTDPADSGPDLSNDCPLPASPSTGSGARFYPLHDDLLVEAGVGMMYYQYFTVCPRPNPRWTVNEACSVFMWDNVRHFGGTTTWDQEAILYHSSGDMAFQVGPGNPETGSGSTTGIQNDGATIGLTYACNTGGSIPDDTVVVFTNTNTTAPVQHNVPVLGPIGIGVLVVLLAVGGFLALRRSF